MNKLQLMKSLQSLVLIETIVNQQIVLRPVKDMITHPNRSNKRIMAYHQLFGHIYWSAVSQIIHKSLPL